MKFTFYFLLFFISTSAFAQKQCDTDALMMGLTRATNIVATPEIELDTAEVIVVPLVFHIVHLGELTGEGTNISDEQVQSAVVALNEDFRKIEGTNGYGIGVDTKIEFCLASRTPDNQPTTGIVRHDGSSFSYTCDFGSQSPQTIAYSEEGVQSTSCTSNFQAVPADFMKSFFGCWDLEDYINVWIVSEISGNDGGNGTQGFSFVGSAGNSFCRNGIVQLYNVTGTTGTLKPNRNMNRTLTHEMGHALGLFHTFGFGGISSCQEEVNCESQGDLVCDTPPTTSNTSCVPFDCPEAMVENYMDYTPQECKNAFTQGQTERMRDELWSSWNGFSNSLGCYPVVDLDGGISNFAIQTPSCNNTFEITISLANYGSEPLSNPVITFSNGQVTQSNEISMTLLPQETESFIFEFTSSISSTISANVSFDEDEDIIENNFSSAEFVYTDGNALMVEVSPDFWSNEIDWELLNEEGEVLAFDGDWGSGNSEVVFTKEVCLFGGCYTFRITDVAGDGLCSYDFDGDGVCDFFNGAFVRLSLNSEVIYELSSPEELDFGSQLTFEFCDEIVECAGDVNGDYIVSVDDVLVMLSNMGCISVGTSCQGDLNGDGVTDINDFNEVLAHYGQTCSGLVLLEDSQKPVWDSKPLASPKFLDDLPVGFYDLAGRWVANETERMRRGMYILIEQKDGIIVQSKVFIQ